MRIGVGTLRRYIGGPTTLVGIESAIRTPRGRFAPLQERHQSILKSHTRFFTIRRELADRLMREFGVRNEQFGFTDMEPAVGLPCSYVARGGEVLELRLMAN